MEGHDPKEPEQLRKLSLVVGALKLQMRVYKNTVKKGAHSDCEVMRPPNTTSQGFGFVTYSCVEEVDAAVCTRPRGVDGL